MVCALFKGTSEKVLASYEEKGGPAMLKQTMGFIVLKFAQIVCDSLEFLISKGWQSTFAREPSFRNRTSLVESGSDGNRNEQEQSRAGFYSARSVFLKTNHLIPARARYFSCWALASRITISRADLRASLSALIRAISPVHCPASRAATTL